MGSEIGLKLDTKIIKEAEIKKLFLPGEVEAILELTVTDKDGKVTEQRTMKSKSFVRQFLELLYLQALNIPEITTYSVKDTGNIPRAISFHGFNFASDGGAGIITHGIVVGTDNTAPTINDYHLGVIILHDAAPPTAGRMQYGAVAFGAPANDATTSQFTITRNFANASGGAITVNEIGLFTKMWGAGTTYYCMTIRDVIGGGILVPNGQTLTVNYRLITVV